MLKSVHLKMDFGTMEYVGKQNKKNYAINMMM